MSYKTLPFHARPDRLPDRLPTTEEIRHATDIIQEGYDRRIVHVQEHFIVKYGPNVHPTEGQNMAFVRERTAIRVPEVYSIFTELDEGGQTVCYIVMEFIKGDSLASCWASLKTAEKDAVCNSLGASFSQLRELRAPGSYSSLGHTPLLDPIFATEAPDSNINGPFASIHLLTEALVRKLELDCSDLKHEQAAFYRHILPKVLLDDEPTFTHADFQTKNVILQPSGDVVLIDWESAGWYPKYWEYAVAVFACGFWGDDWHSWLPKILQEFPNQYMWLATLRTHLWY